jgi:hypothetical protein
MTTGTIIIIAGAIAILALLSIVFAQKPISDTSRARKRGDDSGVAIAGGVADGGGQSSGKKGGEDHDGGDSGGDGGGGAGGDGGGGGGGGD